MVNYLKSRSFISKKRKNVILFIIPLVFIFGFLIWYSIQENSYTYENILPHKTYQIYIDSNLSKTITPIIDQFFKAHNREYAINTNQEESEIIISNNQLSEWQNTEIAKIYKPEYKQSDYNTWEAPHDTIFFSFKKSNSLLSKLETDLKSHYLQPQWSMIAAGDVMLARHVGKKMMDAKNWNLPFLKTADFLKNADITFVNLESPFSQNGQNVFNGMVFGADPQSISGLKSAGIDIVSLANNHFGNQGLNGMQYTFNLLNQNNIVYAGAGKDYNEAHQAKIIKLESGFKVAFLAYDGVDSTPQNYIASNNSAGLAKWDIDQVKNDIAQVKSQQADIIIISMHAGNEYIYQPRQDKINFSHQIIDAGANLVISHHPHTNQKIENYQGNLIFYSLGNLVFDQMWSEKTKEGLIIKLNFYGNKIINFDLVPVYIEDYNQPQIVPQTKAEEILSHILSISNL